MNCELCSGAAGAVLYENERLRVLLVDEAGYPGFCRVIWKAHVKEMTDLAPAERAELMDWVWRAEAALRAVMQPAKINLASLGNVVPHLHWHVIPRFEDDAHFPSPIWAAPRREAAARDFPELAAQLAARLQG